MLLKILLLLFYWTLYAKALHSSESNALVVAEETTAPAYTIVNTANYSAKHFIWKILTFAYFSDCKMLILKHVDSSFPDLVPPPATALKCSPPASHHVSHTPRQGLLRLWWAAESCCQGSMAFTSSLVCSCFNDIYTLSTNCTQEPRQLRMKVAVFPSRNSGLTLDVAINYTITSASIKELTTNSYSGLNSYFWERIEFSGEQRLV